MALIVETGAGLANADSYASLSTASDIATSLGLTFPVSGADEVPAEQALRRATLWIDATYRDRFMGWRTKYRAQALEWPRTGAWDNDVIPQPIGVNEVPVEIVRATVIAAAREKASPGALSPQIVPGQIAKREKVGEIEVEYFGGSMAVADQRAVLTMVEDALSKLLAVQRGPVLFGSVERR